MNLNLKIDEQFLENILEEQCRNFIKRFLASYELSEEIKQDLKAEITSRVSEVLTKFISSEDFANEVLKKFNRRLINAEADKLIGNTLKTLRGSNETD